MEILYQDRHIVTCLKDVGVSSQRGAAGETDMLALLGDAPDSPVYPIHRLDRAVGGCMVYAKTRRAAAALSSAVQERRLEKEYLCVAGGVPEKEGTMQDLLFHDRIKNKTYVVERMRAGVKDALLSYRVLETTADGARSLVLVRLHTGRTHQIRVQFASRRFPLLGDARYGGAQGAAPALWSYRLTFPHPISAQTVCAEHLPPREMPWTDFSVLDFENGRIKE